MAAAGIISELRYLDGNLWKRYGQSDIVSGTVFSSSSGAAPVGTTNYMPPIGAKYVDPVNGNDANAGTSGSPWRTAQYAVTTAASGAYITLRGGIYSEELSLAGGSKSITLAAYPGEAVWFDGSVVVTSANFTSSGNTWVYSGYTYNFDHSSSFTSGSNNINNPSSPLAAYPDQVFLDGTQLVQVAAGTTPVANQFAVDTTAQTLTIGSNPVGHVIRISALQRMLICGTTGSFTMLGIGVRYYATSLPLQGTIFYGPHVGASLLENCVVQDSATQGFSIDSNNGVTIRNCSALRNGMTGFHSNGAASIIYDSCLSQGNNTQNWTSVSAGGIKITGIDGFTIKNSTFDSNLCNGIWTDITCLNGSIVNNTCTNNFSVIAAQGWYGILIELSDTVIVAGNTISGSKYGITLLNSGRCSVWNNQVSNNLTYDLWASGDSRSNSNSSDAACPWVTQQNSICNNVTDAASANSANLYVQDQVSPAGTAAATLVSDVEGNVFPAVTGGKMIQWAGSSYTTTADWNAATGNAWLNDSNTSVTAHAIGLTSQIANALGQAAGAKHYGPF